MLDYFRDSTLARRQFFDREYRIVQPDDQRIIWVHGLGKLELDEAGNPVRMTGTIQDISARRVADERLRLFHEVFQAATEGIIVTSSEGHIIEVNPAFTAITGYPAEEAVGKTPRLLKSGYQDIEFYQHLWAALLDQGVWAGEFVNKRKDGTLFTQQSRIGAIRNSQGEITRFAALISDVTSLKESQRQVEYLAYHDGLTGALNRTSLYAQMLKAINKSQKTGEMLAVCYLDIDNFKPVNDEWGHDFGDRLLVEAVNRLQTCIRASDAVARLGGDEFVVLLCGIKHAEAIAETVERILRSASEPYTIDEIIVVTTISVGIAVYPDELAQDPDTLIRNADHAMYEAKRSGKNRMHFFDQEGDRKQREFQTQYARLSSALEYSEFRLHYQPKVALRTGEVMGVEALIRWQHPTEGLLPPGDFLPVIESTELTLPVGEWVLHEALRQKQRWQKQGINLSVSINVFAKHLQRPDFAERLQRILARFPEVDPTGLELEILETTAMENLDDITRCLDECRRIGVRFSLDDFGTGYSSLTYFRKLPVDAVKIDRSFVRDMLGNRNDQALVRSIVSMARTLGRQVIAEGVETLEHGDYLIDYGCDQAQGFGVARPMPPEMLPDWIARWQMPEGWRARQDRTG
ncbi:MAG: diguanylate cyclase [Candidatus Dactylopiibacterium carminicum]|nr:MAG: diguanylate cyclase [Candidatus Dactylopiibacterium carminicum]